MKFSICKISRARVANLDPIGIGILIADVTNYYFSVAMADTVFNVPHSSCISRLFHNPQIQVIH
jgi:hypothetical protein